MIDPITFDRKREKILEKILDGSETKKKDFIKTHLSFIRTISTNDCLVRLERDEGDFVNDDLN